MKWKEHLKDAHDKGFDDGKNYSNQVNLAATAMTSVLLVVIRKTNWKKARRKLRELFW